MAVRIASRSNCDHIAMILRNSSNELFYTEAIGNAGVIVRELDITAYFGWLENYSKVYYRKLHIDRTRSFSWKLVNKTKE